MEVWIKSLEVDMQVKQQGVELEVRSKDGRERVGNCYATQAGLVWCGAKARRRRSTGYGSGGRISWPSAPRRRY